MVFADISKFEKMANFNILGTLRMAIFSAYGTE